MQIKDFTELAIKAVVDYFNSESDRSRTGNHCITAEGVYVVWQCKTLQNFKAMLSTVMPDGMYYEFTWNGDKAEGYLDAYKKWKNVVVKY
ncbi:MAG: DUF6275 family protein [Clostridia bacterium]|nr:DUF6275 family protein [Clostridia bacterium]